MTLVELRGELVFIVKRLLNERMQATVPLSVVGSALSDAGQAVLRQQRTKLARFMATCSDFDITTNHLGKFQAALREWPPGERPLDESFPPGGIGYEDAGYE